MKRRKDSKEETLEEVNKQCLSAQPRKRAVQARKMLHTALEKVYEPKHGYRTCQPQNEAKDIGEQMPERSFTDYRIA